MNEAAFEDELSLVDLLIVLAKYKRMILGLPLVGGVIAAIVVLIISPTYTATTRILPPVVGQSATLAVLGGIGGGIMGVGKNPSDIYVTLLKSHSVEDGVIDRFGLKGYYDKKYVEDTRKAFEKDVDAKATKDGLIEIRVDNHDPKKAAAIANGMIEALQGINTRLAITEAQRRRVYFEKQLVQVRQNLLEAEGGLKRFQQKTGVIKLEDQGGATLGAMASIEASIAAKEVQLNAMASYATKQHPDYVRIRQELEGLRAQLAKLEHNGKDEVGGTTMAKSRIPETGLEYAHKTRDVKYYETLFEIISKQYEVAKADEAKEGALIQVVDAAVPPERRSAPKRTMIVLLTMTVAFFLGILLAFIRNAVEGGAQDPRQAARMAELKRLLVSR